MFVDFACYHDPHAERRADAAEARVRRALVRARRLRRWADRSARLATALDRRARVARDTRPAARRPIHAS